MPKHKVPHMCITCKNYQPYHCELNDNYVGYIHAGEVNKCRAWRLSDDYKKGRMPKIDRKSVHAKYGGRCAYCGRTILFSDMQVDHKHPQRLGGTDDFENLMPSCRRCNHYKRANTLEVFRRMLMDMERKVCDTYLGKVAKDYGMITWNGWDGKFYFEIKDGE